jgi:hypothetical protein
MSRTLKRPMFRIGGSAGTGITSGLDKPRQEYKKAGIVDFFPTQSEFDEAKAMFPRYERPQGEGLNRFLISTGLDLMSRPPAGKGFTGLLATGAQAAKGPAEKFFDERETDRATSFATDADLFKTLIEAKGEALSGMGDAVGNRGVKLQIADDIETTMDLILKLENKQTTTPNEFSENDANLLSKKKLRLEQLTKNDAVRDSLLGDEQYTQRILRKIKDNLIDKKDANGISIYKGDDDPRLLEDMQRYYLEFFQTGKFSEFAEGGRAGYQMGGGAGMAQEPMSMPQEPMTTNQGPKMDFSTLRARLPQEIGDDVVKLIAASPEALEDFATIATQQDVDLFNQKYSVNLVLPQEA